MSTETMPPAGIGSSDWLGLVERLRHEAMHTGYKHTKPWDLLMEAANEIERLRAEFAEVRERATMKAYVPCPGHKGVSYQMTLEVYGAPGPVKLVCPICAGIATPTVMLPLPPMI